MKRKTWRMGWEFSIENGRLIALRESDGAVFEHVEEFVPGFGWQRATGHGGIAAGWGYRIKLESKRQLRPCKS